MEDELFDLIEKWRSEAPWARDDGQFAERYIAIRAYEYGRKQGGRDKLEEACGWLGTRGWLPRHCLAELRADLMPEPQSPVEQAIKRTRALLDSPNESPPDWIRSVLALNLQALESLPS